MDIQTYTLTWCEIEIEATYEPQAWGGATAHLQLRSIRPERTPLPITGTGYRSHYHPVGTIERDYAGDVVACVTDWLNEAAQDKKWLAYVENSKQGDLFG